MRATSTTPAPSPAATPAANPFSPRKAEPDRARLDWEEISAHLPFGLVLLDPDQEVRHENPACHDLAGFGVAESGGIVPWLERLCPDESHRRRVLASWRDHIWRNQVTRIFSLHGGDGKIREIEFRSSLHSDGGLTLVLRDVTDEIRAQETQRHSKLRFRTLFEQSREGGVLVDRGGTILEANRAFLALSGRRQRELKRSRFADILHPESRPHWETSIAEARASEDERCETEVRLRTRDGDRTSQLAVCPIGGDGGDSGLILCLFDAAPAGQARSGEEGETRLEVLSARLQTVAKKAQALLHSVPDLILLVDPDLTIADFSAPPDPWPEHEPDESWRGEPVAGIWPTLGKLLARSRSTIVEEHRMIHADLEGRRSDTSGKPFDYSVTATDAGDGQILVTVRNRTDETRAREQARMRSESLAKIPSGVLFFDATGRILEANPAAGSILDTPRDQLVDHSVFDLSGFDSIDQILESARWCAGAGQPGGGQPGAGQPGGAGASVRAESFAISAASRELGYGVILEPEPTPDGASARGSRPASPGLESESPDDPFSAELPEHRLRNQIQLITSLHRFEPSNEEIEAVSLRWQIRLRALVIAGMGERGMPARSLINTIAGDVSSLTGSPAKGGRVHASGSDRLFVSPAGATPLAVFFGELFRIVFSDASNDGADVHLTFLRDAEGKLLVQFESTPGRQPLSEAAAWEGEILEILAEQMQGSLTVRPSGSGEEWTLSADVLES